MRADKVAQLVACFGCETVADNQHGVQKVAVEDVYCFIRG